MIKIFIFTEREFDQICTRPTLEEARAFAAGVSAGAGLYGAGSCGVYVMPEDESEMKESETEDEIARAMQHAERQS